MIEFGRVKSIEPPYESKYGIVVPNFGLIDVFDSEGSPTSEQLPFVLDEGRFPAVDGEGNLELLDAETSELYTGINLQPKTVALEQELAFTRSTGFSYLFLTSELPQRHDEFQQRAARWMIAEDYRMALLAQSSSRGLLPEADDDHS
ncbi:hypothetical protein EPN95_03455 [Patescibacteria group bacterium]|nr:MAG: hypothetical protein EPN95_03455 [Patescibacteria group bacterium]